MVVDRVLQQVVLMASSEGGMDIEEVADKHAREDPQASRSIRSTGLADADAEDVARKIGVPEALRRPGARPLQVALQVLRRDATARSPRSTR